MVARGEGWLRVARDVAAHVVLVHRFPDDAGQREPVRPVEGADHTHVGPERARLRDAGRADGPLPGKEGAAGRTGRSATRCCASATHPSHRPLKEERAWEGWVEISEHRYGTRLFTTPYGKLYKGTILGFYNNINN